MFICKLLDGCSTSFLQTINTALTIYCHTAYHVLPVYFAALRSINNNNNNNNNNKSFNNRWNPMRLLERLIQKVSPQSL